MKQIGLAAVEYEHINKQFANNSGDFRQTSIQNNPTWICAILPQLGETTLFDTWAQIAGYQTGVQCAASTFSVQELFASTVGVLYCPSRRSPNAYPVHMSSQTIWFGMVNGVTVAAVISKGSRTDYALNGGADLQPSEDPLSAVNLPGIWEAAGIIPGGTSQTGKSKVVRPRDIKDGLSKTYYAAEKAMPTDGYETGDFWGDMSTIFTCPLGDCVRFAQQPPLHDQAAHFDNNVQCKLSQFRKCAFQHLERGFL